MDWTTFVWMFVMLKIPIALLLWLVWYAIQDARARDGGRPGRRRLGPPPPAAAPRTPRPPRRGGPHAAPLPAPPRVRTAARSRDTTRD